MEYENILDLKSSEEFREWMIKNHSSQRECWVNCKRGKADKDELSYVDAVYVALSFGWIDSTYGLIDGKRMQRFSPRRKNSNWSQLNKERCRWLIRNGLMTDSGYESLPDLEEDFIIDSDILDELKKDGETWNNFKNFPDLYKRIRIANIQKEKDREAFDKKLANFIKDTKDNKMKGNWNDDGRLI